MQKRVLITFLALLVIGIALLVVPSYTERSEPVEQQYVEPVSGELSVCQGCTRQYYHFDHDCDYEPFFYCWNGELYKYRAYYLCPTRETASQCAGAHECAETHGWDPIVVRVWHLMCSEGGGGGEGPPKE